MDLAIEWHAPALNFKESPAREPLCDVHGLPLKHKARKCWKSVSPKKAKQLSFEGRLKVCSRKLKWKTFFQAERSHGKARA